MPQRPSVRQSQHRIVVDRNLPAKMRDGVTLYADVHRPDAAGPFPVILMRVVVRNYCILS
jgi:predicted acyl esterase